MDNSEAVLIDVREPAEHKTANIQSAMLEPVNSISCTNIPDSGKKVVVYCQKGARGSSACQKLMAEMKDNSTIEFYNLEGGIEAWRQAGLPLSKHGGKTPPLDRQVQLAIGFSVLCI